MLHHKLLNVVHFSSYACRLQALQGARHAAAARAALPRLENRRAVSCLELLARAQVLHGRLARGILWIQIQVAASHEAAQATVVVALQQRIDHVHDLGEDRRGADDCLVAVERIEEGAVEAEDEELERARAARAQLGHRLLKHRRIRVEISDQNTPASAHVLGVQHVLAQRLDGGTATWHQHQLLELLHTSALALVRGADERTDSERVDARERVLLASYAHSPRHRGRRPMTVCCRWLGANSKAPLSACMHACKHACKQRSCLLKASAPSGACIRRCAHASGSGIGWMSSSEGLTQGQPCCTGAFFGYEMQQGSRHGKKTTRFGKVVAVPCSHRKVPIQTRPNYELGRELARRLGR